MGWGIIISRVVMRVDNAAAIVIATDGPNWRTRYFGVRSARLNEEITKGRIVLEHEGTLDMVADALTKLGTRTMLDNIRLAMMGVYPKPL